MPERPHYNCTAYCVFDSCIRWWPFHNKHINGIVWQYMCINGRWGLGVGRKRIKEYQCGPVSASSLFLISLFPIKALVLFFTWEAHIADTAPMQCIYDLGECTCSPCSLVPRRAWGPGEDVTVVYPDHAGLPQVGQWLFLLWCMHKRW